ncbi:hypothetical protein PR048_008334 [Dryococelus australis]|uniref:NYN domain-containing protein n=1 Tax=Dryococelus australis TaxID=614101 RepID=A0ABQ9HWT6_9NEOP|nr:hypothetical protein PR048_008334 [Dryococelus australis]
MSSTAMYGQIADAYLDFVQKQFKTSMNVIFYGYNVCSIKSHEQIMHDSKRISAEHLITLLSHHFETAGIEVCNADGDADTLIGKIAHGLASEESNVTVITSDTNIVVMLLAQTTDEMEIKSP